MRRPPIGECCSMLYRVHFDLHKLAKPTFCCSLFSPRIRLTTGSQGSEPDTGTSTRSMTRELRRKKHGNDEPPNGTSTAALDTSSVAIDEVWWKSYFEKKLELEREKMKKEEERHKDRINFQKMALMLQERAEKLKVDAMNNLTTALLKLQDASQHL